LARPLTFETFIQYNLPVYPGARGEQTMKRTHLVAVVVLSLITLIFAYSQSPTLSPQSRQATTTAQTFTIERQVSTQQRINRHFHGDVVPKLKNCWKSIRGKGTISLKYTYTKADTRWSFSKLEASQSTLPRGQERVALRCMQDAVRGTSFPLNAAESTQNTFVLNWTWPVPFPGNALQLTTAMFAAKPTSGGSGGCDGWGTAASCYTCKGPTTCERVCVGYNECNSTEIGGTTQCSASGKCASGGPFGVTGGSLVIY